MAIRAKGKVKTYRDLVAYQEAYSLAKDVFHLTAKYPKDERFSLVDQMRRASRSIALNMAEGWAKRKYENVFKRHIIDSVGSCVEMKVCFDISLDCGYIGKEDRDSYYQRYNEVGLMLDSLVDRWITY